MLDPAVYRLLEHSFGRIEQLEPWLEGAKPTAEVAILSQLKPRSGQYIPGHSDDVEGAAQCFLETAIQFDFVREGDYVRVNLPPVGPHTVVVLE